MFAMNANPQRTRLPQQQPLKRRCVYFIRQHRNQCAKPALLHLDRRTHHVERSQRERRLGDVGENLRAQVIEGRLAHHAYLGGAHYSVADMATFPWSRNIPALLGEPVAAKPGLYPTSRGPGLFEGHADFEKARSTHRRAWACKAAPCFWKRLSMPAFAGEALIE